MRVAIFSNRKYDQKSFEEANGSFMHELAFLTITPFEVGLRTSRDWLRPPQRWHLPLGSPGELPLIAILAAEVVYTSTDV
jgi:hypothetical protein